MQSDTLTQIAKLHYQLGDKFTELAGQLIEPPSPPIDPPDPPTEPPAIEQRLGRWVSAMKLQIVPIEQRPDAGRWQTVTVRYRLKDLFTTRSGSWEPKEVFGSIEAWARAAYLRPFGAPDWFDDAGGDHYLFARVLDAHGRAVNEQRFIYWSDGLHKLTSTAYAGYVQRTAKVKSGWANQDIYNYYDPAAGQVGAWCWCPVGAADVVVGGGMPGGDHISTFAVWQMEGA